ncbi:MAG: HDIG domain-containing metalloprotein [Candidatus Woesearchaeota archaeon]
MKEKLTSEQCILLLKENDISKKIFLHSRKVNAVAKLIASKLINKGVDINYDLVDNASLLHDIKKEYCLKNDRDEFHEEDGALLLKKLGFPNIGNVIFNHRTDQIIRKEGLTDWESKIVYYADKRVQHDTIVSINQRINDGKIRYPHLINLIDQIIDPLIELEKQIFKNLDIKPEDINEDSIKPYLIIEDY